MVYFIQDMSTGWIKIGFSKRPKNRFRAIQRTTPHILEYIGAIPGGLDTESHYHGRFRCFRMWREWFNISRRQAEEIIESACYIGKRQRQEALALDFSKPKNGKASPIPKPIYPMLPQVQEDEWERQYLNMVVLPRLTDYWERGKHWICPNPKYLNLLIPPGLAGYWEPGEGWICPNCKMKHIDRQLLRNHGCHVDYGAIYPEMRMVFPCSTRYDLGTRYLEDREYPGLGNAQDMILLKQVCRPLSAA